MIRVEPDAGGSRVESQVRCDDHGVIATRFAVLETAVDSALRHRRYRHHRDLSVEITIHPAAGRSYSAEEIRDAS